MIYSSTKENNSWLIWALYIKDLIVYHIDMVTPYMKRRARDI